MGNRTPDLFHAMEALYQLSYSPVGLLTLPPAFRRIETAGARHGDLTMRQNARR